MNLLLDKIKVSMEQNNGGSVVITQNNDAKSLLELNEVLNNNDYIVDILESTKYTITVRVMKVISYESINESEKIETLVPLHDGESVTTPDALDVQDELIEVSPRKRTRKKK